MSGGNAEGRGTPPANAGQGMPNGGRALRCEEARVMLMEFIDGELAPRDVQRIEDHLAVCVACRREERAYRRLEEGTQQMADEELQGIDIDAAWENIYRRLERAFGWLLLSIGLIILTGYGAWHFLQDFLLDSTAPLLLRVGVGAGVAGMIVLLISIGRERLFFYRTERYREVQR